MCNSIWLHIMFIKEVTRGSWTHQNVWVIKNANTDISLCGNFQEYVVYNKCENVKYNVILKMNKTNKHNNKQN